MLLTEVLRPFSSKSLSSCLPRCVIEWRFWNVEGRVMILVQIVNLILSFLLLVPLTEALGSYPRQQTILPNVKPMLILGRFTLVNTYK
jgi:hypothetical protein